MIDFICHQQFENIQIPISSSQYDSYYQNLLHQKPGTRKAWKWILVAQDSFIHWLANQRDIMRHVRWMPIHSLLLNLLWTLYSTILGLPGPETCSLSSSRSRTTHTPLSLVFSSQIIMFRCSGIYWADGLILWPWWYSSQCLGFDNPASIGTTIYV